MDCAWQSLWTLIVGNVGSQVCVVGASDLLVKYSEFWSAPVNGSIGQVFCRISDTLNAVANVS